MRIRVDRELVLQRRHGLPGTSVYESSQDYQVHLASRYVVDRFIQRLSLTPLPCFKTNPCEQRIAGDPTHYSPMQSLGLVVLPSALRGDRLFVKLGMPSKVVRGLRFHRHQDGTQ
jgi:hypothetical protein